MNYIDLGYTVDLNKPGMPLSLTTPIVYGDSQAHRFTVSATRDGEPETMTGTCAAYLIRLTSNDYVAISAPYAELVDGKAIVVLPEACYSVSGAACLLIKLTDGDQTTTILNLRLVVGMPIPGTAIDPGSVITRSFDDLIE